MFYFTFHKGFTITNLYLKIKEYFLTSTGFIYQTIGL